MKNSIPGRKGGRRAETRRAAAAGLGALERRLGHRFRRRALLEAALTHPSFRFETPGTASDNQRLEFLGDAALALAAADRLFRERPDAGEGPLTEARTMWVGTATLARAARSLDLGPALRLGRGETLAGGADRDRTLEDALEAVLGAVFLDGGWRALLRVFDRVLGPAAPGGDPGEGFNPKGALQEYCQGRWKTAPEYRTVGESGRSHRKRFEVEVLVGGRVAARGEGASRRAAQAEAAALALAALAPGTRQPGGSPGGAPESAESNSEPSAR